MVVLQVLAEAVLKHKGCGRIKGFAQGMTGWVPLKGCLNVPSRLPSPPAPRGTLRPPPCCKERKETELLKRKRNQILISCPSAELLPGQLEAVGFLLSCSWQLQKSLRG